MRCRSVGLAALVVVLLAGSDARDDSGFIPLFDGKTLKGWSPQQTDRFSVRDGVLVGDGGTGWLRSEKAYRDFEFRAEYRALKKGGDSGLFFRASAGTTAHPPHWPARAYQLEVIDAESNLKLFGHGTPPPQSDRRPEALKAAMKGTGHWQRLTLRVVGAHAEATLEGVPITVSDAIQLPEGHIGLQGENGHFEWRDLKLKELPAR